MNSGGGLLVGAVIVPAHSRVQACGHPRCGPPLLDLSSSLGARVLVGRHLEANAMLRTIVLRDRYRMRDTSET